MLTKRIISGSQNLVSILALSILAAGCQPAALSFNETAANNTNAANAAAATPAQTNDKMITIKQGTVGRIGNFSIGVKSVSAGEGGAATAAFAVWNSTLTPEKRNDYNIKFSAASGTLIPIGNKFYKIGKITVGGADSTVEIESKPIGDAANLSENALAVPVGGNLELHGAVVEAVSVSADGKQASVEVYSNDYPKEESAKKAGGVVKSNVAAGDELEIGGTKHKIIAVHAAKSGAPAVLEISLAPVK